MSFHYRFSRGDKVQIISGKFKGHTGTVDANVFQRSVDFPKDHLPCHHVLLDNHLVITINVNQVEALDEIFHRTSTERATEILRDGFKDNPNPPGHNFGFHDQIPPIKDVWFSDFPVGANPR
ncbi:MAG: hypothetical protein Ct9H300mP11_23970 [Chloroflexota bacterium]|nr:MAG: hypothetical protein Ct9H300mP11_23970 [Chloroflexota bacterium]